MVDAIESMVRGRFAGFPEDHIQSELQKARSGSTAFGSRAPIAHSASNMRAAFSAETADSTEARDPDSMSAPEKAALAAKGQELAGRRRTLASAMMSEPAWKK